MNWNSVSKKKKKKADRQIQLEVESVRAFCPLPLLCPAIFLPTILTAVTLQTRIGKSRDGDNGYVFQHYYLNVMKVIL